MNSGHNRNHKIRQSYTKHSKFDITRLISDRLSKAAKPIFIISTQENPNYAKFKYLNVNLSVAKSGAHIYFILFFPPIKRDFQINSFQFLETIGYYITPVAKIYSNESVA